MSRHPKMMTTQELRDELRGLETGTTLVRLSEYEEEVRFEEIANELSNRGTDVNRRTKMSTNPVGVIKHGVHEARQAMREAAEQLEQQRTRIDALETALNRMVLVHENTQADSEGHYPASDSGCAECSGGATPDRYNTGLCAYHNAKKLLGHTV